MGTPFFGELLILFLCFTCLSRIFFLKYGKVDVLTILAPVSIILSILQIIAWDADIFVILIFIIALLTFFTNFRALLRFSSGLFVDHYSIAFKAGAFTLLSATIAVFVILIANHPVNFKPSDFKSIEKIERLSGSFSAGFTKSEVFEPSSAFITIYEPENPINYNQQALILITDKRGNCNDYEPYALCLSEKGYRVYVGSFFTRDLRWFHTAQDIRYFRKISALTEYFKNPVKFEAEKEFYTYNSMREIEAMVKYVKNREPELDQLFLIGDKMANTALNDYAKIHEEELSGILHLTDIEEYKTPGFGFIELTNPFISKKLGIAPVKDFSNVRKVADTTIDFIPIQESNVMEEIIDSE